MPPNVLSRLSQIFAPEQETKDVTVSVNKPLPPLPRSVYESQPHTPMPDFSSSQWLSMTPTRARPMINGYLASLATNRKPETAETSALLMGGTGSGKYKHSSKNEYVTATTSRPPSPFVISPDTMAVLDLGEGTQTPSSILSQIGEQRTGPFDMPLGVPGPLRLVGRNPSSSSMATTTAESCPTTPQAMLDLPMRLPISSLPASSLKEQRYQRGKHVPAALPMKSLKVGTRAMRVQMQEAATAVSDSEDAPHNEAGPGDSVQIWSVEKEEQQLVGEVEEFVLPAVDLLSPWDGIGV